MRRGSNPHMDIVYSIRVTNTSSSLPISSVWLALFIHPRTNSSTTERSMLTVCSRLRRDAEKQINLTTLAAFPFIMNDAFVFVTASSFIKVRFYYIAVVESVPGIPLFLQPSSFILIAPQKIRAHCLSKKETQTTQER